MSVGIKSMGNSEKVSINGVKVNKPLKLTTKEFPKDSIRLGIYNSFYPNLYTMNEQKVLEINKNVYAYTSYSGTKIIKYNKTGKIENLFSVEHFSCDVDTCSGYNSNNLFIYTSGKLVQRQMKSSNDYHDTEIISNAPSSSLCVNRKDLNKVYFLGEDIHFIDLNSKNITKITRLSGYIRIYDSYMIDNKIYIVTSAPRGSAEIYVIDLEKNTKTKLFEFIEKFNLELPLNEDIKNLSVQITDKNIHFSGSILNRLNMTFVHFKHSWNIELDYITKSEFEIESNHDLKQSICFDDFSIFITNAAYSNSKTNYFNETNTIVAYKEEEE